MRYATCLSIVVIWYAALAHSQVARPTVVSERLELARQYLLLAGINAPDRLDVAHIAELREALRHWSGGRQDDHDAGSTLVQCCQFPEVAEEQSAPKRINISTFYPTLKGRWARLLQFNIQGQEQARTAIVDNMPVMNPNHVLIKLSLIGAGSQMFLMPSDISTIYTAYANANEFVVNEAGSFRYPLRETVGQSVYQLPTSPHDEGPCQMQSGGWRFIDCLLRVGKKNMVERAFYGLSGTASYSQNPLVQQGILILPGSAAYRQRDLWSGEVDYDPTNLFPNGTDWSKAVGALNFQKELTFAGSDSQDSAGTQEKIAYNAVVMKRNKDNLAALKEAIENRCGSDSRTSACIDRLAAGSTRQRWIAALVPTFTYKVQTNFDFYKNGGSQFVPNPFPENHLWNFSFTNDLRKVVAPIQTRADAATALKTYYAQAANYDKGKAGSCSVSELPSIPAGSFVSYPLDNEGEAVRTWKLANCQISSGTSGYRRPVCAVNGLTLKADGVLSGYPEHPGVVKLEFEVSSSGGTSQTCTGALKVLPSLSLQLRDELILDYLELAISPEVLVDENWFASFKQIVQRTLLPAKTVQVAQR